MRRADPRSGAIDVDALELVLDADGVVLAFEIDDTEFLREGGARARRVDHDVAVDRLVAVVGDADDLAVLHDRRGDASVEPVLRPVVAAVAYQIAFEVRELQHGTGLVADVVFGRRLEDDAVGVLHHDVVGDAEGGHHGVEGPRGGLVALTRELVLGLGLEDDDVVPSGGEIAGTLCAGGTGTGDDYVVAVVHVIQTVVDLN